MTGEQAVPAPDKQVMTFRKGREEIRASVVRSADGSALCKIPAPTQLDDAERSELSRFLNDQISQLMMFVEARSAKRDHEVKV